MHSSAPRPKVPAWDFQSVGQLLSPTAAACGPHPTLGAAQLLTSHFPAQRRGNDLGRKPPRPRFTRDGPPVQVFAAILTKSASDSACIFRITCPRWIFTVISLVPSSNAICLLSIARNYQSHDVALAGGERFVVLSQTRQVRSAVDAPPDRDPKPDESHPANPGPGTALVRNSTAPDFMAFTVIGISPWPVMNMIGIWMPASAQFALKIQTADSR